MTSVEANRPPTSLFSNTPLIIIMSWWRIGRGKSSPTVTNFNNTIGLTLTQIGCAIEWLERRDCNRHDLGLKAIRAILLCPLERHFLLLGNLGKQLQISVISLLKISSGQ